MAEINKGIQEIGALLASIANNERPPIAINLERMIDEVTSKLEEATSTLNSVTIFNNEAKKNYDLTKKTLTSLKSDLDSFTNSYKDLFGLIGISYTDETFSELESDVSNYVDSQKALMDSYKVQMDSLGKEIEEFAAELKTLQTRLREHTIAKEKLATYMKQAESGELSLSKKELYDFLSGIVDENGLVVFDESEIPLAAQIIAFSENFDLNQSGLTVGSVLQAAMAQPDEGVNEPLSLELEPIEEQPIQSLPEPEEFTPKAFPSEELKPLELPTNLRVFDISEPVIDSKEPEPSDEIDPYALIEALAKEDSETANPANKVISFPKAITYTPEEQLRLEENLGYLKSIGIPVNNIEKYPVTLYQITIDDIKEGLALASKAGIKVGGIGDIVALCSRQNVNELLDLAIEIYGPDYVEVAKKTPLCKILETARQHTKEVKVTNRILESYVPEIAELDSIKDNVSGKAAYMVALGMEDKLSNIAKSTPFAYVINGIYIPRQRLEKNLERLSNLDIPNEKLLLAAIATGSKLTAEQIEEISDGIQGIPEETMRLVA